MSSSSADGGEFALAADFVRDSKPRIGVRRRHAREALDPIAAIESNRFKLTRASS